MPTNTNSTKTEPYTIETVKSIYEYTLTEELEKSKLPRRWETIIERLYSLRSRWPSGARTGLSGKGSMHMEVAFRTWEDHFTVWKDDKVVCGFTINAIGTIALNHSYEMLSNTGGK